MSLAVILLLLAFIILALAAAGMPSRVNLLALGLAIWVLSQLAAVWRH